MNGDTETRTGKGCTVIVFMDEIGDLGKKTKNIEGGLTSRIAGFGISVTRHPDKFGAISALYRKKYAVYNELKARDTKNKDRLIASLRIRISGAKTYGYYVDKLFDVPKVWNDNKGSDLLLALLKVSLDNALRHIEDKDILVVVDYHNAYDETDKFNRIFSNLSEKYDKNISGIHAGSRSGDWKDQIQTTDFVAYAIHSWHVGMKGMTRLMGMRLKRLGDDKYI